MTERLSLFVLVTRGAIPPFQPFSHNSLSRKKKTPFFGPKTFTIRFLVKNKSNLPHENIAAGISPLQPGHALLSHQSNYHKITVLQ
jgi:hypothetical protein